jgi:hypothetical protein
VGEGMEGVEDSDEANAVGRVMELEVDVDGE